MLEHVLNSGNQLRTDLETSEGFASVDYERILIVGMGGSGAVSYTHLTLPTMDSV